MGNLLSRKGVDPNDFEKILGEVDAKIRKDELSLTQIRSSERRVTLLFLAYTSLIYGLLILYIFFYPNRSHGNAQVLWDAGLLLGGPFLIYWGKRLLSWFYRKRLGWVEADLKALRAKQKLSVEDLKKKTAYYQTKGLLERFDPENKPSPSKKEEAKPKPIVVPQHPQPSPLIHAPQQTIQQPQQTMKMQSLMVNAHSTTRSPVPHQFRIPTWYDKLLDSLIGDDRSSKYALICQQCYTHNGLVLPEEFESTQYVCPNCHYLNPARRPKTPRSSSPQQELPFEDQESPSKPASVESLKEISEESIAPVTNELSQSVESIPESKPKEENIRNRKKTKNKTVE